MSCAPGSRGVTFRRQVALLCFAFGCARSDAGTLECEFVPVQTERDELAGCASRRPDGSIALSPGAVAEIQSRGSGPLAVSIDGVLHYANAAGRAVPVWTFDNGADYFSEGLARTHRDGKIGFVDRDLIVRIPPTWDFAFPFSGGFALVCQGCQPEEAGEHREVVGGRWGRIDRGGAVVVPVTFPRDQVPEPPPP